MRAENIRLDIEIQQLKDELNKLQDKLNPDDKQMRKKKLDSI